MESADIVSCPLTLAELPANPDYGFSARTGVRVRGVYVQPSLSIVIRVGHCEDLFEGSAR